MNSSAFRIDPVVTKLLCVQSEIRRMRNELLTLELTSSQTAGFEAALMAIERRARRLFTAAAVRNLSH